MIVSTNKKSVLIVSTNQNSPGASVAGTKVIETIKHRTVRSANIVMSQALAEALDVVRRHSGQELNILLGMESVHVRATGNVGSVDLHLLVQTIVEDQGMCHC